MPNVQVNGNRVYYSETGSGEPVIPLHCTASSGAQWKVLGAELRDRYRVLAVDLSGYGKSPRKAPGSRLLIDDDVEAIARLVGRRGEPAHLIGHSYGGAVALVFALRRPDLVKSLTLIEPAMFHLLRAGSQKDKGLHTEISTVAGLVAAAAVNDDPCGGIAHFMDFWNGKGSWGRMQPHEQRELIALTDHILADFVSIFAQSWPLETCRQIACPALLIEGAASVRVTRRISQMLADTIPHARRSLIEGAGHMAPITNADAVNRLIMGHLARMSSVAKPASPPEFVAHRAPTRDRLSAGTP